MDNQLPRALVDFFVSHGHKAIHVLQLGMDEADDKTIWAYAEKNQCVIVTKDEDFLNLSLQTNSTNQIVWVRLGNCRAVALLAAFGNALPKIVQTLEQGGRVIELR